MRNKKGNTTVIAIIGAALVIVILVFGTIWIGQSAGKDTQKVARSVSLLYLDELAGRREQVVSDNIQRRIGDMETALELMTEDDFRDEEHLKQYQAKMKRLFTLQKFAFVNEDGLIYTSLGTQDNIDEYAFDYDALTEPVVFIKDLSTKDKKVVIASPLENVSMNGEKMVCCFMEINMDDMLEGVSMHSQSSDTTFCNLYTSDGVALTDTILGGLAEEDNLLEALSHAKFEKGYSYEEVKRDFENHENGDVAFTYNGISETLSYRPVAGTDWMLTYLIRESVVTNQISSISNGILIRSIIQSVLTISILLGIFALVYFQNRKNNELRLEKETADAETRIKQQELDERIAMQEKIEQQSLALSDALAAAEDASKAKTVFLSNMSHEIRTPMNAIIGLDNIALNDPDTPPKTREYLEKIGVSAEHLLNLINDILDMSRIESGRMTMKNEEFYFPKLLEAINTMFSGQCTDKGLDYTCRLEGEFDDYYIGDNMKLRQVLINILGNAVKFTPEGGKVELAVKRVNAYKGQTTLQFVISDTGIGMSEEFLPHIFDTFVQEDPTDAGKYGSSGLGMAITKNIVEMMNGNIEVQSKKGEGSVFTVTVTLTDSDKKAGDSQETEVDISKMSVLIIDDDPVACEHARLVLEKAGIASEIAMSGAEAVEKVNIRHARREPYNLILVDLKMPEMDGVETTRKIREVVGNESAIIILTAYRWDDVLEEAINAGVDSFLAKPIFAANVIDEFRTAFQRKNAGSSREKAKVDLTGKRILLAEDMEINADIMKMVLQMREMEVEVAENGQVAVDNFTNHPAGYYDAILMDMRMPVMDGLEATRTIRAMDREDAKSIPVIALTANAFDEDVQRSMQAGLNAHLSKPVQPDDLFETLEGLIR
ncbi:MAG: response regulator [Lachnospiraceae bacterium]|nr:response regulator [Lachnospiraceae bacterium]